MTSVFLYILVFTLSTIFFELYERSKCESGKTAVLIIAIIIPCILAGLRDVGIGTDTSGYVRTLFETASISGDIVEYYKSTFYHEYIDYPVVDFDLAYTFLAYFCAHVFRSFGSFLFFSELLVIVPIVAGLIKLRKSYNISLSLSMLMFYFLFYNITFNAARQFISVAFCFLAVCYLLTEKNNLLFYIFGLIGFLFHRAGLLLVLIFLIYKYADIVSNRSKGLIKNKTIFLSVLLLFITSLVCIFSLNIVAVPILKILGLERFVGYINGELIFSLKQLIYQLSYLIILFIEYKRLFITNKKTSNEKRFLLFFLLIFIIYCVSCQLASINENSWRIRLYFDIFNIVLFSYLYNNECDKRKKILILFIIILYLLLFWMYTFLITGRHQTIPYIFGLKGL